MMAEFRWGRLLLPLLIFANIWLAYSRKPISTFIGNAWCIEPKKETNQIFKRYGLSAMRFAKAYYSC